MRRIKVMLLSMAMLLGVSGAAYAGDFQGFPTVDLKVNGKAVYSDVPGILMSGRTMVPLRVISESLNVNVAYDSVTNNVLISPKGATASVVTPAKITGDFMGLPQVGVLVNGRTVSGDVPPIVLNGRTLVPVRLVAQALGAKVDFANNTVSVTSGDVPNSGNFVPSKNNLIPDEQATNIDELSAHDETTLDSLK